MTLTTRKLLPATVAATVLAISTGFTTNANAVEVAASAAVSNMYLWRGQDLGNGDAAVSGDLVVSAGGAYGGVWASSGDSASGNEYDLFVGYGHEFGDIFSVDISLWNYVYPSHPLSNAGPEEDVYENIGDLSEIILSLGAGPVSLTIYDNISGGTGYMYYTLGAEVDKYSVTLGFSDDDKGTEYSHLDLSYAYNDNLSITLSGMLDSEIPNPDDVDADNFTSQDDVKIAVTYSLPIDL